MRNAFRYFSAACWDRKPMVSAKRPPSSRRWAAASKSCSPLAVHCATRLRRVLSGGRIEYFPVFVSRVGNAAEDILGFFEPAGRDDNHSNRITQISQRAADSDTLYCTVGRSGLDHQEIDVAVARHLTPRSGPEQNDAVWLRHLQNPAHDLVGQLD